MTASLRGQQHQLGGHPQLPGGSQPAVRCRGPACGQWGTFTVPQLSVCWRHLFTGSRLRTPDPSGSVRARWPAQGCAADLRHLLDDHGPASAAGHRVPHCSQLSDCPSRGPCSTWWQPHPLQTLPVSPAGRGGGAASPVGSCASSSNSSAGTSQLVACSRGDCQSMEMAALVRVRSFIIDFGECICQPVHVACREHSASLKCSPIPQHCGRVQAPPEGGGGGSGGDEAGRAAVRETPLSGGSAWQRPRGRLSPSSKAASVERGHGDAAP